MLIQFDEIGEEGLHRSFSESSENFGELARLTASGECRFAAPIEVELQAQKVGALVEVSGEVRTRLGLPCSRCLREVEHTLVAPFELTFQRRRDEVVKPEAEVELNPEDLGLIEFDGEKIDLSVAIEEQVLLALPLQPLCSSDCRGLCPHCGADLNNNPCSCADDVMTDSRFAALKKLKLDR